MIPAKLYASRIAKRAITILDVPKAQRKDVMKMLSETDHRRMELLIEKESQ